MSPERKKFVEACWLAGWTAGEASAAIAGSFATLREIYEISQIYVLNDQLLEQSIKSIKRQGVELDRH